MKKLVETKAPTTMPVVFACDSELYSSSSSSSVDYSQYSQLISNPEYSPDSDGVK